jgi:hypothetical protein
VVNDIRICGALLPELRGEFVQASPDGSVATKNARATRKRPSDLGIGFGTRAGCYDGVVDTFV